VELLLARIARQNGSRAAVSDQTAVFPTELILRGSVGPRPAVGRIVPPRR
jgi:DNA-binding LacI/PurR family transcriptional regulator